MFLYYSGKPPRSPDKSSQNNTKEVMDRRYLQCPAAVTIGHLKKFIRMKFNLCDRYQIDIYHTDEALSDTYTLIDVAYIYFWRRKGPLKLFYTVYTNPSKKLKSDASSTVTSESAPSDLQIEKSASESSCSNNCNSKNEISTVSVETNENSKSVTPEKNSISPSISSSTHTEDKVDHAADRRSTCGSADSWSSRPLNGSCDFSNHYDVEVPQDLSINKNKPIERRHSFGYCKEREKSEKYQKGHGKEKDKTDKVTKANGYLPNGEIDKFAFTDEDELPIGTQKLHHIKTEPVVD